MKATGIVRRMDDLGRVVVPKELRRTMKISEGTPLEIFIDKDGSIIFRKYSPVGELNESAKNMAECISAASGIGTAVCLASGIVLGLRFTPAFVEDGPAAILWQTATASSQRQVSRKRICWISLSPSNWMS